jgi:hypothetical protein
MAKIYGNKVPSINVSFEDGTHKSWKKWTERKLITELTKLLNEKTKLRGRASGDIRIVYQKDPDGDYLTRFSFINTEDAIKKLMPSIEPAMLRWFYASNS